MCKALLPALLLCLAAAAYGSPADRPGHRKPALTEHEVEQALELIERISPELVTAMRERYTTEPEAVEQALLRKFPRLKRFLAMKRWDPMMFDLRVEEMRLAHRSRRIAQAYRAAAETGSEADAARLREQLTEVVTQLVAARDAVRRHELQRLEDRLDQIRQELADREQQREHLVKQQVKQLIAGDPEGTAHGKEKH